MTKEEFINELIDKDFEYIEKAVYKYICEIGIKLTKEILETKENLAYKNKPKHIISRGNTKTIVRTLYGDVFYTRKQYFNKKTKKYVNSSNEHRKVGLYSKAVVDLIENLAMKNSYREVCNIIKNSTNQNISHQGVWNIIQQIGNDYKTKLDTLINNDKKEVSRINTDILCEEIDGIYISQQRGRKKEIELKSSIAYTGYDNDNKLNNVLYYVSGENAKKFQEKREMLINKVFEFEKDTLRITNTDGAAWCKNVINKNSILQLDRFHIYRNIRVFVKDKNLQKRLSYLVSTDSFQIFKELEDAIDNTQILSEKKDLRKLYNYLYQNRNGLIRYKYLTSANLTNKKIGNLGCIESANYITVAKRMKKKRMSWSKEGANNLLMIICNHLNTKTGTLDLNKIRDVEETEDEKLHKKIISRKPLSAHSFKEKDVGVYRHKQGIIVAKKGKTNSLSRTLRGISE